MKVSAMAITLLLALHASAGAQDSNLRTDCAWWTSFDKFTEVGIDPMLPKLSYVAGVYDGLVFGKSQIRDQFAYGKYETISTALDEFCAEPDNRQISLVPALRVIAMQIKGESEQLIEQEMRQLRELARDATR